MICGALVGIILGVQPVCSEAAFVKILQPVLQDELKVIARVVFDEYLENLVELHGTKDDRLSRTEEINDLQMNSNKADMLFDELLDSIAVLSDDSSLRDGIMNLRRTILLAARNANNPWKATTWFDIAALVPTNTQFLEAVDSFLLKHADDDRSDRFIAIIAKLEGDRVTCAKAERRTMQRWAIYNKLIEPFENESTLENRYPAIPKGESVADMFFAITDSIKDQKVLDTVSAQMDFYTALHKKQKHTLIELIENTRINDGVDPLSSGCGLNGKTKNKILQRTAEMHELNTATVESMLLVLTPKQRQELTPDE